MKDFTRPAGRLRALPFHARLTYSIFLVFTLVALALTGWLGADMLKPDLSGFSEYYAGTPTAPPPPAAISGGPTLDLPAEAIAPPASDPIPLRKLLEVTHFHLFSIPVYLMILSHLFMLSSLSPRTKTLWISLGTAGVLSHIAAPWLARTPSNAAKAFYILSGTLLTVSFVVMATIPLLEMWRSQRNARIDRSPSKS